MAVTKAEAVWQGTLREGKGTMKLPKGKYEGPFTFASRFETGDGTNPEELIGAAHAGCFSMFLSGILTRNDYTPTRIHTTATVTLGEGPAITKIELNCEAEVPNLSNDDLQKFAADAKAGCPVSKALAAVNEIVLNAKLV